MGLGCNVQCNEVFVDVDFEGVEKFDMGSFEVGGRKKAPGRGKRENESVLVVW